MTDAQRAARERIRQQAVERFEAGEKSREIAAALRVSVRSVERWRRQWREDGAAGIASKGSPGRPKLSDAQIARLEPPMREFIEASKDWLTVLQLPSYAPDLNPQEGILSLVKRTIGNLAAANLDQLARAVRRSLKQIQYRPHLIDGCLTTTGLIMDG
nr:MULTISPECIES: helix-turn-helix domain-containing protein [unclassified Kitasatospora]